MIKTPRRWRRIVMAAFAVSLVATACSSDDDTDASDKKSPKAEVPNAKKLASATLLGSGSTFQQAFNETAMAAFKEVQPAVTVTYAGGGSGKGQTDLQAGLVDFAGTDALPKPEDLAKFTGGELLYFPTVGAPITVAYNVDGLDELNLSADTIAKIFQREVKTWDDAAIKADNPDAELPSDPIVVVHRSDSSGTTGNFTKFLKAAAPGWTLGSDKTIAWPSDTQAGNGNSGVAQLVADTAGAIGYVDFSDAMAAELSVAAIKNDSGSFVEPSLDAATIALGAAEVADDLSYDPLNATGAKAYPITSPTWIMVYKNQTDAAKGAALKAFLLDVLTDAQDLAGDADFAKLPEAMRAKAEAQLDDLVIGE